MLDEKTIKQYSEYLTFRSFYTGFEEISTPETKLNSIDEIDSYIHNRLKGLKNSAILISSGMDSANLLPHMPKDCTAYTILHENEEFNEVDVAKSYCDKFNIRHKAIKIKEKEYLDSIDSLMIRKKMPLSPAEPIFYLAAKKIKEDGHENIVTGGGADSKIGGFPRFRGDYSAKELEKCYRRKYLNPEKVLVNGTNIKHVLNSFTVKFSSKIDTRQFLRDIGIERFAFNNAIEAANCKHISPFAEFIFDFDEQLNNENPKYVLRALFKKYYDMDALKKFGMQKPSTLLPYFIPTNSIFDNLEYYKLNYPQKFLLHSLDRFHSLKLKGVV